MKPYVFKIKARVFKENGIWIIYHKRFNVSGYGKTKRKAQIMFNYCINDILKFKYKKNETTNTRKRSKE